MASLDKAAEKKIRNLILLAGLILVIVLNITSVINGIGFALGILYPFILGGCVAFLLNIPMSFLERHLFSDARKARSSAARKAARPVSLILAALIIAAIIVLVMFYFLPKLTSAVGNLGSAMDQAVPQWNAWLQKKFAKYPAVLKWIDENNLANINFQQVLGKILDQFVTGADTGLNRLLKVATKVINTAANFGIAIAVGCYVCAAKEKHHERAVKFLYGAFPTRAADEVMKFCHIAYDTFHKFVSGQILECICLAFLVGTVLSIAQMPYAFLIAIVCAVCCFIPIFGAIIAGVFSAIMILTVSSTQMIIFIIIYVAIRIFDDNFMYPHIMGRSIGMPSIFVLLAITVGGALFGFGGMLVFIPLFSVFYKMVRRAVRYGLNKRKLAVDQAGKVLPATAAGTTVDDEEDYSDLNEEEEAAKVWKKPGKGEKKQE